MKAKEKAKEKLNDKEKIEEQNLKSEVEILDEMDKIYEYGVKTKIEELTQKIKEDEEKFLRLFAEFDNYKKRTQKEKEKTFSLAKGEIIEQLLPIIDAIEQAKLMNGQDESFKQGMELVSSQISMFLEKNNVTELGNVGEKFDIEIHEAISVVENEELEENHIVSVFRKGYKIDDKVIRPAMVIVSK